MTEMSPKTPSCSGCRYIASGDYGRTRADPGAQCYDCREREERLLAARAVQEESFADYVKRKGW